MTQIAITNLIDDSKIKQFELYTKKSFKYEFLQKILKITSIIFGLSHIVCIASLFITNISSILLLNNSVKTGFTCFFFILFHKYLKNILIVK